MDKNVFGLPVGVPKPIRDLVLLKRVDPVRESSGGMEIPQDAQQVPYRAVVLAAGPGGWNNSLFVRMLDDIVPGAHVFVNQYAGQEFEVETVLGPARASREKYILARVDELLGVFDPADLTGLPAA